MLKTSVIVKKTRKHDDENQQYSRHTSVNTVILSETVLLGGENPFEAFKGIKEQ